MNPLSNYSLQVDGKLLLNRLFDSLIGVHQTDHDA